MLKKGMLVLVPVLAAVSPIAYYSAPEWWSKTTASVFPAASGDVFEEPGAPGPGASSEVLIKDPSAFPGTEIPIEGAPVESLQAVLRFDVTPDWIVRRWPRVSAGLAYLELQGYRAPLVTGTAEDDLAGAITYYFNPRQELQRITFYGSTGNTQKLVDLVTARFGFARRLTNDAGVFLYEIPNQEGRATSFLWIRPARVVTASDPHGRFEVALVVERPK